MDLRNIKLAARHSDYNHTDIYFATTTTELSACDSNPAEVRTTWIPPISFCGFLKPWSRPAKQNAGHRAYQSLDNLWFPPGWPATWHGYSLTSSAYFSGNFEKIYWKNLDRCRIVTVFKQMECVKLSLLMFLRCYQNLNTTEYKDTSWNLQLAAVKLFLLMTKLTFWAAVKVIAVLISEI